MARKPVKPTQSGTVSATTRARSRAKGKRTAAKGRPGGPSRLSVERRELFFSRMKVPGMARETAARCAGIPVRDLARWIARGRRAIRKRSRDAAERQYREFVERMTEAEATAEAASLSVIARAGTKSTRTITVDESGMGAHGPFNKSRTTTEEVPGDWKALAWILERREPERFGRVDRHKLEAGKGMEKGAVFVLDTTPGGSKAARPEVMDANERDEDDDA